MQFLFHFAKNRPLYMKHIGPLGPFIPSCMDQSRVVRIKINCIWPWQKQFDLGHKHQPAESQCRLKHSGSIFMWPDYLWGKDTSAPVSSELLGASKGKGILTKSRELTRYLILKVEYFGTVLDMNKDSSVFIKPAVINGNKWTLLPFLFHSSATL